MNGQSLFQFNFFRHGVFCNSTLSALFLLDSGSPWRKTLKFSILIFQVLIQTWKTAVKAGKLKCPIPNCKAKYFAPRAWIKHLLAEAEVEKDFFAKVIKAEVECPYCSSVMSWQSLPIHFNSNHRDVSVL